MAHGTFIKGSIWLVTFIFWCTTQSLVILDSYIANSIFCVRKVPKVFVTKHNKFCLITFNLSILYCIYILISCTVRCSPEQIVHRFLYLYNGYVASPHQPGWYDHMTNHFFNYVRNKLSILVTRTEPCGTPKYDCKSVMTNESDRKYP